MEAKTQISRSEVAKFREAGFKVTEETAFYVYASKMRRPPTGGKKRRHQQMMKLASVRTTDTLTASFEEFRSKVVNCFGSKVGHEIPRDKLRATLWADSDYQMKSEQTVNARISAMITAGILEVSNV